MYTNTKAIFLFTIILFCMVETKGQTSTKIIAHRGAWQEFNLPENSIASLEKAIALNCYGSEFDVRRTKDGQLVVNHDPKFHEDTIELKTYAELNNKKLSNGEDLPTLSSYFAAGTKEKHNTLLICEIKQGIIDSNVDKTTTLQVLALAKKMKIEKRIVYISFSFKILQWIKEVNPKAIVLYLENNKTVEEITAAAFNGINYYYYNFQKNPTIASKAKEHDLMLGSWTVNTINDLKSLEAQGITYITTNRPQEFLLEVAKY
jgi:glycerophosphoryl diester phosphodiesterase